jgi:putative oxidoreductase
MTAIPHSPPRLLPHALLLLRIGVFFVMFMWSLDKLVNPAHAAAVFENFYYLAGMATAVLVTIGIVQLVLELGFLFGLYKFWTYGYVLIAHFVSTASSWQQYLSPLDPRNMLFHAAIPMLAACVALFMLRDHDTMFTATDIRTRRGN